MKNNKNNPIKKNDDSSTNEEMSRRLFLEYGLKLTGLIAAAPMLQIKNSFAETVNIPKRFVNFNFNNGLCQFSSYLSPTASYADLANLPLGWKAPGLATSFRPSSSTQASKENVDYSTSTFYGSQPQGSQPLYLVRTSVGNYRMPVLWSSVIPAVGGGTTVMKNLISSNCAIIQGLESAAAHAIAKDLVLNPEPGGNTIGGYISASTPKTFFPALKSPGGVQPFKTPQGGGARTFSGVDPVNTTLRSMLPPSNEPVDVVLRRDWLNAISSKVTAALASISISNSRIRPGISVLYDMLNDARSVVDQRSYQVIVDDFNSTYLKYKDLETRAIQMAPSQIQGITDSGVSTTTQIDREILRTFDKVPGIIKKKPKLALATCTSNGQMAYIFAFIEVALKHNLTNVIQVGFSDGMVAFTAKEADNFLVGQSNDNHERGAVFNLLSSSLFHYVFNTLLLGFRQSLVGGVGQTGLPQAVNELTKVPNSGSVNLNSNSWFDTIILVGGDFPRNPRFDGTGSDHAYEGAYSVLFSGRIPGSLKIFGATTLHTSDHFGAWGKHSVKMKVNGNYLSTKDVGASIAGLFVNGLPHPGLKTIMDRSNILFSLDANGNIKFSNFLPACSLETT